MAKGRTNWKLPFFTIWTGQQLSLVGSRAAQFALVWWLTTTTGSATVLATATMVALIPQIILGPIAGAYVDRWSRRVVMFVADTFIALVSLWLAYLFWTDSMQVWHVYVVMLSRSVGEGFHWPAMAASTSLMVPKRHLSRVAGMNQTMHGMLTIIGAPLGALLLELLPLHNVMLVDVGTALFAVLPLLFIAIPQPVKAGEGTIKPTIWADVRVGLRYLSGWKGAVALISGAMIFKVALTPAFSLMPLLVRQHFGGGAPELSVLEAIAGVGILGGGLLLSVWGGFKRKVFTVLLGIIGVGLGILFLGIIPARLFVVALGSAFFLGVMISLTDGPIMAIFQSTVDPGMQGRVFSLLGSLVSVTSPIGLAIAGPVSDLLGIRFWYVIAGILCVSVGVAGVFIPSVVHIEDHEAETASSLDDRSSVAEGATVS